MNWHWISHPSLRATVGSQSTLVHSANQRDSSGTALADTAVHNLRATWAPDVGVLRGATVRVGVENLFDLDYVGHLSSPTRKAPGRTLNVTLTKTF